MAALDLVMKEMCAIRGFRRFDGSDFYMHCVDVANFLISYGITDRDAIVGALLHDMIEDVECFASSSTASFRSSHGRTLRCAKRAATDRVSRAC